MKLFVGVTDNNWYKFLSNLPEIDEVNFWQPSGKSVFKALQPGELFLFKLHSPLNYIVGGGVFAHSTILPLSLAWDAFEEKNGATSYGIMRQHIAKYRKQERNIHEDFKIGCIILDQPFFFNKSDWIPLSDWKPNIVRGKSFDLKEDEGRKMWLKVRDVLTKSNTELSNKSQWHADRDRFGKEQIVKPRLGQGSFRILITDVYRRTCAVTQERALPVLEAAHIKPYSENGPHRIDNGLLMRSDIHKLFDTGYLTITPQSHIEVSRRIKEEYDNGKYYYTLHGQEINRPERLIDQPSKEFLTWHNENVFRE